MLVPTGKATFPPSPTYPPSPVNALIPPFGIERLTLPPDEPSFDATLPLRPDAAAAVDETDTDACAEGMRAVVMSDIASRTEDVGWTWRRTDDWEEYSRWIVSGKGDEVDEEGIEGKMMNRGE